MHWDARAAADHMLGRRTRHRLSLSKTPRRRSCAPANSNSMTPLRSVGLKGEGVRSIEVATVVAFAADETFTGNSTAQSVLPAEVSVRRSTAPGEQQVGVDPMLHAPSRLPMATLLVTSSAQRAAPSTPDRDDADLGLPHSLWCICTPDDGHLMRSHLFRSHAPYFVRRQGGLHRTITIGTLYR